MRTHTSKTAAVVAILCILGFAVAAEDWPTYRHDVARSGVTGEQLTLPLSQHWVHEAQHAPKPAWPAPAKRDIWHQLSELRATVTYDRAFHTVAVGDTVYFGSSADDAVYALDAATGETRWSFVTEGPVRLAPTVAEGRIYFGSDDGSIYCLDAATGAPVWQRRAASFDHRIPGNGRMISLTPARTGVLVDDGVAYCCVGMFPAQGVYLCAFNADTGADVWQDTSQTLSPQGYLVASPSRLFVPTGRTTPAMFSREEGKYLGELPGTGGAYAVLVGDAVMSGPGRQANGLTLAEVDTREGVASFDGLRIVVNGDAVYVQSKREITAIPRSTHLALSKERHALYKRFGELKEEGKKLSGDDTQRRDAIAKEMESIEGQIAEKSRAITECVLWKTRVDCPFSLVLAGDTLFAGGLDEVVGVNTEDGVVAWRGEVRGRAYGLAAANGALLVSTSEGTIHAFRNGDVEREHVARVIAENPYADDDMTAVYAAFAERVLEETGITKGYALVLDCNEGRLAYELLQRSDLHIVAVDDDATQVAAARAALRRAGVYGARVSVHHVEGDALPYTSYFANLVVSDGALVGAGLSARPDEVGRVLRPWGGVALVGQSGAMKGGTSYSQLKSWARKTGADDTAFSKKDGVWATIRRGAVPDSGEWTQLYANAGHTASTAEEVRDPMTIQWFGEPGPRDIIDRHHRPMSPLFKNGRVFVPANDKILAVDAYNGTLLWDLPVPNSRRVGALKNSGHMLLTDEFIYCVTEDECWAVDVAKGSREAVFQAPQLTDYASDWGYLNRVDNRLFGTMQRKGASFSKLHLDTVNMLEGDFRPVIVSEGVFAMDRFTGETLWTHRGGAVMNNACTIDEKRGRIYFVESRNEKAAANTDGRMRIDEFCGEDAFIVALDLETGRKLVEEPFTFPFEHIMFACIADDTLVVTGTFNRGNDVYYGLYGFKARNAELKWQTENLGLSVRGTDPGGTGGSHGEQWQHPVIIGSTLFLRPHAFDLKTGEKLPYIAYRGGHGCGGLTGSQHYLFGRGDNPRMYPIETEKTQGIQLTRVSRPGCWLNIIPVGGLILIPESSSGCTCAYPVQTSFALAPKALSGLEN